MRTISIIRWVNGLRALTSGLTVTAPAPARSGGDTTLTTPVSGEEATLATTVAMAHAAGNGTWTPVPFRNSLRLAPYDDGSTDSAGLPDRTTTVSPAELPAAASHGPAMTPTPLPRPGCAGPAATALPPATAAFRRPPPTAPVRSPARPPVMVAGRSSETGRATVP